MRNTMFWFAIASVALLWAIPIRQRKSSDRFTGLLLFLGIAILSVLVGLTFFSRSELSFLTLLICFLIYLLIALVLRVLPVWGKLVILSLLALYVSVSVWMYNSAIPLSSQEYLLKVIPLNEEKCTIIVHGQSNISTYKKLEEMFIRIQTPGAPLFWLPGKPVFSLIEVPVHPWKNLLVNLFFKKKVHKIPGSRGLYRDTAELQWNGSLIWVFTGP